MKSLFPAKFLNS